MGAITPASKTKRLVRLVVIAGASIVSTGLCILLLGLRRFAVLVEGDIAALFARANPTRELVVTEGMLQGLPEPVQRYLTYTGIVGKPFVRMVRLEQEGAMHPSAEGAWMALEAEEHYTVEPPGFVWDATMRKGILPIARGRDMYATGEGHMLIRAGSLFTLVDASGPEMDQGSMMRYLSEMIWFPTAFLGRSRGRRWTITRPA